MGYIPVGTHDWNKYLSPEQIRRRAEAAAPGLQQLDVQGMVLQAPPPPVGGNWKFRLDPADLDVNLIGTYQHQ